MIRNKKLLYVLLAAVSVFCSVSCINTQDASAAERAPQYVETINISNAKNYYDYQERVEFGVSSRFSLQELEAELLLKNGADGEWIAASPFSSDNLKGFQLPDYGLWHIQLNIRNPKDPGQLQRYYVGSAESRTPAKFLDSYSLNPRRLVFSIGEELTVDPVSSSYDVSKLEYRVSGRYNGENWQILHDFTDGYPIKSTKLDKEGYYNIAMEVRDPNDPSRYEMVVGTQIAVAEFHPENVENLLRILSSNYSFFTTTNEQIIQTLSREVDILARCFLYQARNEDVLAHAAELDKVLKITNLAEAKKTGIITFDNPGGMLKELRTDTLTALYNRQYINLDLAEYPTVGQVLNSLRNYPEEVALGAVFTHLVYNHYQYNNVPGGDQLQDLIFSIDGHCAFQAELLFRLLNTAGYPVRQKSADFGADGTAGAHGVVEFQAAGRIYCLDATVNVVYLGALETLKSNFGNRVVLPQIYDRYFTMDKATWSPLRQTYLIRQGDHWDKT